MIALEEFSIKLNETLGVNAYPRLGRLWGWSLKISLGPSSVKIPCRDIEVEGVCVCGPRHLKLLTMITSVDGKGREERERETERVQGMKGWAPSPVLSVAIKWEPPKEFKISY